jgi:hypothetical protein
VLFEPISESVSQLRVFVIGEVGTEIAPVTAYSVNDGPKLTEMTEQGLLGPLELPKGKRAVIDVVLQDSLHCALGVNAYAN